MLRKGDLTTVRRYSQAFDREYKDGRHIFFDYQTQVPPHELVTGIEDLQPGQGKPNSEASDTPRRTTSDAQVLLDPYPTHDGGAQRLSYQCVYPPHPPRESGTPALHLNLPPPRRTRSVPARLKPKLTCPRPSCVSKSFGRPSELRRHNNNFHDDKRATIQCPASNCSRNQPFSMARKDKVVEHIRAMHKSPEEIRLWPLWSRQLGKSIGGDSDHV